MGFLDDLRGKSGKAGLLEKELLAPTDEGDMSASHIMSIKIRSLNLQ